MIRLTFALLLAALLLWAAAHKKHELTTPAPVDACMCGMSPGYGDQPPAIGP